MHQSDHPQHFEFQYKGSDPYEEYVSELQETDFARPDKFQHERYSIVQRNVQSLRVSDHHLLQ